MSEDAKKAWPCVLTDNRVKPCWALDEVLQQRGRGTKAQGLELLTLVNMKTMKHSRTIVVLKSGKHGKNGLALNFCPYCREDLREDAQSMLTALSQPPAQPASPPTQEA
jgi:hypothetical protein